MNEESTVVTEQDNIDTNTPEVEQPQKEQTNEDLLVAMSDRLRNGRFGISMSFKTLKHMRSFLQSKAAYKGHQEAIYLATATFVLEQMVSGKGQVSAKKVDEIEVYQLPTQAIQIMNYFLGKAEGVGYNSVETFLQMSAPIQEGMVQIEDLQKRISELTAELQPVVEGDNTELTA